MFFSLIFSVPTYGGFVIIKSKGPSSLEFKASHQSPNLKVMSTPNLTAFFFAANNAPGEQSVAMADIDLEVDNNMLEMIAPDPTPSSKTLRLYFVELDKVAIDCSTRISLSSRGIRTFSVT